MMTEDSDWGTAVSLLNNDWIMTLITEKITFMFDVNVAVQTTHTHK